MTSVTIHTCSECEYYQEPFNDYPERGMYECGNCHEYLCDEHTKGHSQGCCFLKVKETQIPCAYCGETPSQKCKHCSERNCNDCQEDHAVECCNF